MLTPAGQGMSTSTSLKSHAAAMGAVVRPERALRVDGPATIPGPHFRRSSHETPRQSAAEAPDDASAKLAGDTTLGYLTVTNLADNGFVGGLLVTNLWGRPLEFQCTAPVKPNRAQEILYGPTLRPVLFGELIAATLIAKASTKPALVLTDQRDVLPARPLVKVPIVCIESTPLVTSGTPNTGVVGPHAADSAPVSTLNEVSKRAHCWPHFEHDTLVWSRLLRTGERLQDLDEPFQRIHLCIEEVYP
jgi:hypothetical protein